jgi:DNA replication protein DnaC
VRTAYDEIIATAVKRQNQLQRIISELLAAELSEKRARSIKYQMTIAKLPLAKDIDEFDFEAAEVNETLIRDLATGDFLDHQRNLVLIGGTGKGKTHLAVSIACPSSDNLEVVSDQFELVSVSPQMREPRRNKGGATRRERRLGLP